MKGLWQRIISTLTEIMPLKCKIARQEYARQYRIANSERIKKQMRAWHLANREKAHEDSKKWRGNNRAYIQAYKKQYALDHPEKIKESGLKKMYDLTLDQYNAMLVTQNNLCAVCGEAMDKPHVDHCHDSGKVRGLVHRHCNTLLGFARDRIDILQGAINYLEAHKK